MAIQRAIVSGKLGGIVDTKTIFTGNVTVIAGDEPNDYWGPYLGSIYQELEMIVSTVWQANEIAVYIPAGGQWELVGSYPYTAAGGVSGDYMPNAVAAVLLGKATGIRHIGRKFISGLAESATLGNSLTTAAAVYAASALLAYITPLTTILGSELVPGIVDKNGAFHPFTGGVVSSLLGSMRRRKPGVGI